jgi:hypothetical protein
LSDEIEIPIGNHVFKTYIIKVTDDYKEVLTFKSLKTGIMKKKMGKAIKTQKSIAYLFLLCLLLFIPSCTKEYSLKVNILPAGSGTISLLPGGGTYEEGTEVTLTPVPESDYKFTVWSGADASYLNNDKLVMSKNMDITANFEMKTLIRLKTGSGLNNGAQIYFVALSKDVNYFDLSVDEKFGYRKTDADWYIDGELIPFTTDYKEFDLTTGEYYFLLSATGVVVVTTVTISSGKQTILISGSNGMINIDVSESSKSMHVEGKSSKTITYKR